MGLNIKKRQLIGKKSIALCENCKLVYNESDNFCTNCGIKLIKKSTNIYANFGKNGITSISYKTADGITINSKGNLTIPFGNGISYTISSKKRK